MRTYSNSKLRKVAATLAFCLALSGCGAKGNTVVSDYGDMEISSEESSPGSAKETSTEDPNAFLTAEGEDGNVQLDLILFEDFEENDITYSIFSNYSSKKNLNEMHKYSVARISDSEELEKDIVESLFGDTGKKVTTISNEKYDEYVSFLNKYKSYKSILEKKPRNSEYDNFECVVNYDPVLTPGDAVSYDWVDNDNYYIHIYEGQYNDVRFGLMIAYDKVEQARYIYFNPVSVEEYYPGKNIKTVMLRNSVDINGNPCIDNECTLAYSDVQEQVERFLDSELGINDSEASLGCDYNSYNMRLRPLIGFIGSEQNGGNETSISQVVFSDSDFAHSVIEYSPTFERNGIEMKNTDQFPRSVEILAEQDDRMGDSLRKGHPFMESLWDPYKYMDWTDEEKDKISYTYDGYALYINPGFANNYNVMDGYSYISKDYIESAPINSGVVEVTSKGIFGVDIVQMLQVYDVSPTRILNPEKLKDKLMAAVKSEDFTKLIGDKDMVFITGANLIYYYDEGSSAYVPAWDFPVETMLQKEFAEDVPEDVSEDSNEVITDDISGDSTGEISQEVEVMFGEPGMHIYVDAETGEVLEISK